MSKVGLIQELIEQLNSIPFDTEPNGLNPILLNKLIKRTRTIIGSLFGDTSSYITELNRIEDDYDRLAKGHIFIDVGEPFSAAAQDKLAGVRKYMIKWDLEDLFLAISDEIKMSTPEPHFIVDLKTSSLEDLT